MQTPTEARAAIAQALNDYYFPGLRTGDVALLAQVFHPSTQLFGDINGRPYAKILAEYLDGVAQRVSPAASGQPFATEIQHIEVINSIAVAQVRVHMYAFHYYDLLSFHLVDGRWLITHKLLTHRDE
ncbi:nuclear transport factor 2 family protein [Hymenobacter sp. 15J16-1T3B]|uniref:nuclear transport factor 2 family protein n=1 Tax=Hymenobacter sp. 15J16-1T3B TaxID=2886941 RepID=UPI001D11CFC0|nr:nuclear transport factor 2 family protein [Hymenobacter sp. 15J16-1T3B]MCC3158446.1 nuclear transport factor 2 family protein [Hymenobacter sp. 15J16-1T3B]